MSAAGRKGHGWRLEDAERRNRESPDSFFIPERTRRENLRPGDGVKLLFMLELPEETGVEQVERMWVEVKSASGGRYTGRLMNEPVTAHELRSGADVEFGPEHVAAFLYDQAEIGYDLDGMVFVSVRLLERRTRPAELYYEKPTDRRDSGWHPEIEAALRDPRPGWWVWDDREAAYVHQRR